MHAPPCCAPVPKASALMFLVLVTSLRRILGEKAVFVKPKKFDVFVQIVVGRKARTLEKKFLCKKWQS